MLIVTLGKKLPNCRRLWSDVEMKKERLTQLANAAY